MKIELTADKALDYLTTEYFVIKHPPRDDRDSDLTHFQICRGGEDMSHSEFCNKYKRKFGDVTITIKANNPLNHRELRRIMVNPFKFINEHPFSH